MYQEDVNLNIYSILGKKELETRINPGKQVSIDISKLTAGQYIVMINTDDRYQVAKFIKN